MHAIDSLIATRSALELLLVGFALFVLPSMSLFFGLRSAKERRVGTEKLIGRYMRTALRGVVVAIAVLLAWKLAGRSFEELGLGLPPAPLEIAGIAFALATIGVLAWQVSFGFKPSEKDIAGWKRQLDALKLAPRNTRELFAFFPVAITAGVWEEIFYRGFLMWFFAPLAGIVGSIAISSVIFGIGHAYQGWKGVLRTTLAGLVFATGYALTGSLWWLMILHAAIDVFAGILAWRVYSMHRDNQ
jgi:membrane protease YdiL (CAAX protease family)